MSIVAWIGLGLVGATLAGWLCGARRRELAGYAAVGVLGALLGGFLASVLLGLDISGVDATSLLVAGVGAAILVVVLRALPPTDVFE